MEALVPELPELPKPKRRWLPRFSLGALVFVVLCVQSFVQARRASRGGQSA